MLNFLTPSNVAGHLGINQHYYGKNYLVDIGLVFVPETSLERVQEVTQQIEDWYFDSLCPIDEERVRRDYLPIEDIVKSFTTGNA